MGSVYTTSLDRRSIKGKEMKKEKSKPSFLPLSKIVLKYREPSSPLTLQFDSLVEKITATLEKKLTTYPFDLNLIAPFGVTRASIRKYVASIVNLQPMEPQ